MIAAALILFNRLRSRLINWLFWRYNPNRTDAMVDMVNWQGELRSLDDVRRFMSHFEWIPEPVEWQPTPLVTFARKQHGDCQTAAVMGAWALSRIGKPAAVYTIRAGLFKESHAIAVSDDRTVMVSNDELIPLLVLPGNGSNEWENYLFSCFDNRFNTITRA
jgi:hypothetical protein